MAKNDKCRLLSLIPNKQWYLIDILDPISGFISLLEELSVIS